MHSGSPSVLHPPFQIHFPAKVCSASIGWLFQQEAGDTTSQSFKLGFFLSFQYIRFPNLRPDKGSQQESQSDGLTEFPQCRAPLWTFSCLLAERPGNQRSTYPSSASKMEMSPMQRCNLRLSGKFACKLSLPLHAFCC